MSRYGWDGDGDTEYGDTTTPRPALLVGIAGRWAERGQANGDTADMGTG